MPVQRQKSLALRNIFFFCHEGLNICLQPLLVSPQTACQFSA